MTSIHDSLTAFFQPGQIIEVRAISDDGMASGYFDSFESLVQKVKILGDEGRYQGIYVTLNEVNPALLARRANRIKTRLSKKDSTTADADIIRRRWFPIDIDPVRPSGVSSSEDEHASALWLADLVKGFLSELGWPEPLVGDSGNGAHLLYRIDLPNDTESRELVKGCLDTLSILFSNRTEGSRCPCLVDTANFNAGRIWKLYGTLSRKGDSTPERPHRRSAIISSGDERVVTSEELKGLVNLLPREDPGPMKSSLSRNRPGQVINLGEWLDVHHLGYDAKPYMGGTLFVLAECPFSGDHRDGAYAIQFPSGAIFAGCHHQSCGGGSQRWTDLKEMFDGPGKKRDFEGWRKEQNRQRAIAKMSGDIPEPDKSPEVSGEEKSRREKVILRANEILGSGDPLRFIIDTFGLDHEGDRVVAECLARSLASRSVINSKGLHVSITGESGKGKSHTVDTMLQQVPDELRLDGRMSDKALFYVEGLRPGSVIALDDISLSDQMQEILKGVTTSFQKPFRYRTVSKDRTGQVCTIPERCVWWVAKVEGSGDDQVWNRMLTVWIDDSEEQDAKVLARTLNDAKQMPSTRPQTRDEVQVCQEIWRWVCPSWVVIPYADRIRFQSSENRRNPDMLLDLIKTNAVLMQKQREQQEVDGMTCIIATEEDFTAAARLFAALHGESGGQVTKLTRKEAELIDAIRDMHLEEVTIAQMQSATGWSHSVIYKMLHGYTSRGYQYSGLLEKCPAISFHDRTVTTGDEGLSTQRRSKVFTWNPYLYDAWAEGGAVWLSGPTGGDDSDDGGNAGNDGPSQQIAGSSREKRGHEEEDNSDLTQKKREKYSTAEEVNVCSGGDPAPAGVCTPVHDPGVSADEGPRLPPRPPIPSPCTVTVPNDSGNLSPVAATTRRSVEKSVHPGRVAISTINPKEFRPVDGWPDKKPCIVCGRKPTHYQERMKGKEKPGTLCKACYHRAVTMKSSQFRTIPGIIDVTRLKRWTGASVGRCHVCDGDAIAWQDPGDHFGMCETCYSQLCESEVKV